MAKATLKKPTLKAPKKKVAFKTKTTAPIEPEYKPTPAYSSLDEVMDKSRDIAFFYSGVEYSNYLEGCYDMGIRNFLMSYHYLSGRGLKGIFDVYPDIHLFVDSGAFTYTTDAKYAERTVAEWEEHIQKYLRWAERHKEQIFAIANLDIEGLVGAETVTRWNREYFEPFMLQTGIPVCFVYHDGLSDYDWKTYCQRYPYVGFSSINVDDKKLDMNEYREYLRTAEKYDALVHGFGMTKIKELAELPYYTVDSTTWKVGMMYGKLIIFDGRTVKQIGKEDWEEKAFPLIQNYPINIDFDLLWDYDEPEVIRANVYAFMLAENYVKDRIKSLQYWQKAKAVKNDLDSFNFPSVQWIKATDKTEFETKELAKRMNINPDRDSWFDVVVVIEDMTTFIHWYDPEYQALHEPYERDNCVVIHELHNKYINRIVPDLATEIEDLRQFYTDCFVGNNDTLLHEGTNFDRLIKERDNYVDDTEYEKIELSREDVLTKIGLALPPAADGDEEAPDIDSLDDEVYSEMGLTVFRDEEGRVTSGSLLAKKPEKNVFSKAFPKFACDTCYAAAKCPQYKAGYVCAYNSLFHKFDTRNVDDILQAMHSIANHSVTRMQRAMVMEVINGTLDGDVTGLIDQNIKILDLMKRMHDSKNGVTLRQTRTMQADGSFTETMSVSNPQSGGIMEKLFSNLQSKSKKEEPEEVIEADYTEVDGGENDVTFEDE